MHEAGLITELLDSIRRELAARPKPARVRRIELRVGRLSGANPEALRLAFEALSPGTPAAGATLELVRPPVEGRCRSCGARVELDDPLDACPRCGGAVAVTGAGARELLLQALELEEE